jgi:NTE family protein
MTSNVKRALVLSGGGLVGAAWMLGLIDGLRRAGIDLGGADLVVGTSAGGRVGAQLTTGLLDWAVDLYRRSEAPQYDPPAQLRDFVSASTRIIAAVPDRREAAQRIAMLPPLGSRTVPEAELRRVVAAHLQGRDWPARRLVVSAVDAASGERVAFDADSGASLLDAVAASGALPGILEPVRVGGRGYVDGGVYSLYSADLAAGHDVVVVLTPVPLDPYLRGTLDAELEALRPAATRVIVADETSLTAMGSNALSPQAGRAALEAGAAQAEREVGALQSIWPEARPGRGPG